MANCPSCGAEVSPVGVFCPKCGADLQAPPRSAAASAPASDPVSGAGPVRETVRARTPGVLSLTVKGRSSRAKFWIQFAIVQGTLAALGSLVACICAIVALRGADVTEDPALFSSLMVRTFAWSLLLLMPLDLLSGLFSLPMYARRWHDLGCSGWHVCLFQGLGLVPFIGGVCRLVQLGILGFASGPRTANRFGPPCGPCAPEEAAAAPAGENPFALWALFWLLEAARAGFAAAGWQSLMGQFGN